MNPDKTQALQRLHNRLRSLTDWPRELQFAAVEDALILALPADSAIVEQFRDSVAELTSLERKPHDSFRDGQRIKQLEEQVELIIAKAEEAIDFELQRPRPEPAPEPPPPGPRFGPGALAAMIASGLGLLALGWVTALSHYEGRLEARLDRELRPYEQRFDQAVARVKVTTAARLDGAERLGRQLAERAQALARRSAAFDATLIASREELQGLRDDAVTAVERRLAEDSGGLARTLAQLKDQAQTLEQGLAGVGTEVAALDQRVPALGVEVDRLAGELAARLALVEQASGEAAELERKAPEVLARLERQAAQFDQKTAAMAALTTQIEALHRDVVSSRQGLDRLAEVLAQGMDQVAGWGAMDSKVAARQGEVLDKLNRYAALLETRVQEFLEVLNVSLLSPDG